MKNEKDVKSRRVSCIYMKHVMPAISCAVMWITLLVPCSGFSHNGESKGTRSVMDMVLHLAPDARAAAAQTDGHTKAGLYRLLANDLRFLTVLFFVLTAIICFTSVYRLIMAVKIFSSRPNSPACNKRKVWARFFLVGEKFTLFLSVLPIFPSLFAHIAAWLYRWQCYETVYVLPSAIFPVLLTSLATALSVVFAVIPMATGWEDEYEMSIFKIYGQSRR